MKRAQMSSRAYRGISETTGGGSTMHTTKIIVGVALIVLVAGVAAAYADCFTVQGLGLRISPEHELTPVLPGHTTDVTISNGRNCAGTSRPGYSSYFLVYITGVYLDDDDYVEALVGAAYKKAADC